MVRLNGTFYKITGIDGQTITQLANHHPELLTGIPPNP